MAAEARRITIGELCKELEHGEAKGDHSKTLAALERVQDMTVTPDELKRTKVGFVVKSLRKSKSDKVCKAAGALFTLWKKLAKPAGEADGTPVVTPKGAPAAADGAASEANKPAQVPDDVLPALPALEKVRGKVQQWFHEALALEVESAAGKERCLALGRMLEKAIFDANGDVNAGYKTKSRQLYVALKAKGNVELREMVNGTITSRNPSCDFVVNMTAEELASPDVKARKAQMAKNMMEAGMLRKEQRAVCTHWKCEKCEGNETSYTEMQTRGADEPLTVFVHCENPKCGHNWVLDGR